MSIKDDRIKIELFKSNFFLFYDKNKIINLKYHNL